MFPESASSPTPEISVVPPSRSPSGPSDDDVLLLGRSPETAARILSPQNMYSDLPGPPISPRPQTGRSNSWYTPLPRVRRGTLSGQPPLPAGFQAHNPAHVSMPPDPPAFQLPEYNELMSILREHRLAQLAAVDQQRELMRYMSSLSDWLGRDVQDRQAELRAVTARIDQLRDDLNRMSATPGWHLPGMHSTPLAGIPMPQPQATGQGAGGYVVPPPGIGAPPPPVVPIGYPPGFVPQLAPQPFMMPEIKSPRQPFSSPGPSRWDIPDPPPQYADRTGPFRRAETPNKGYPLLGRDSVLVMHTLVFVISIVLALGTFVRAEPVRIKGQDDLHSAIEPSTSAAGHVYFHETSPRDVEYREAAFCYIDRLDTASVNNVQESLSDVPRAFFTTPLNVTSDATWRGVYWEGSGSFANDALVKHVLFLGNFLKSKNVLNQYEVYVADTLSTARFIGTDPGGHEFGNGTMRAVDLEDWILLLQLQQDRSRTCFGQWASSTIQIVF